jgi:hypothetical protein
MLMIEINVNASVGQSRDKKKTPHSYQQFSIISLQAGTYLLSLHAGIFPWW